MTQTQLLIIILILAVMLLVISVRESGYKFWRKRKTVSVSDNIRMERMVKLADEALGKLNCDVTWSEEDTDKVAAYDYQNGHFRLRLTPGTLYAHLGYYFCFSTSVDNIHTVRTICNQCNLNSEVEKLVYSVNEKKNEIDVHVVSSVLLHPDDAKDVLANAMGGAFSWQNAFGRRFREMDEEQQKERDLEIGKANYNRELFLLRQQELREQGDETMRMGPDRVMHLDMLLDKVMGITGIEAQSLVVQGKERQEFEGHESIMALDLKELLLLRDYAHFDTTVMTLDFDDPGYPGKVRTMTITVTQQGDDGMASYYRFTLCLVPLPPAPETPFRKHNELQANSVLVACDRATEQQLIDESNYMWKEAMEKVKTDGIDSLTEEQKLICECIIGNVAQQMYIGKKFFLAGRFYEALPRLEMVFHDLNAQFDTLKSRQRDAFFEVCYLIGFIYVELKQYDRAMTYLDMVSNLHRITYTEEMINCMVNSGDFRSLNYIDQIISNLESGVDPNDDETLPEPHIMKFLAFLKRRKVFVLVEKGEYEKAKTLLNGMLDDPENADYAINELAYIQKKEKNPPQP